jgi:hypothetical protein
MFLFQKEICFNSKKVRKQRTIILLKEALIADIITIEDVANKTWQKNTVKFCLKNKKTFDGFDLSR